MGAVGGEAGGVGFLGGGVVEGVVRGGPFEVEVDEFGVAAWFGVPVVGFSERHLRGTGVGLGRGSGTYSWTWRTNLGQSRMALPMQRQWM